MLTACASPLKGNGVALLSDKMRHHECSSSRSKVLVLVAHRDRMAHSKGVVFLLMKSKMMGRQVSK